MSTIRFFITREKAKKYGLYQFFSRWFRKWEKRWLKRRRHERT